MTKKNLILFGFGATIGGIALIIILRKILIKYRVVALADKEWQTWGYSTIDINGKQTIKGGFEADDKFKQRVGRYWKEGTGLNYDGGDRAVPWSAAFISWLYKKAGAGDRFVYNSSHSKYITDSIANRKNGNLKAAFVGYRLNELSPKIGDMVCYSRQSGINYDSKGSYKSHCDIVVAVKRNQIEVVGGNVADSVTKKILRTDSKGKLIDKNYNWFAVIKNNI